MEAVYPDGTRLRVERTVTTVDRWIDTALGRLNAGYVVIGQPRFVTIPPPAKD